MLTTKKLISRMVMFVVIFYALICLLLYLFQEKLIFFPEKLNKDYAFQFAEQFTELNIPTNKGRVLHGLLFTSDSSKGLIFYLHGNAGSVNSWGEVANRYTELNYDVFVLDYPGYGKSEGSINGQEQLFDDIQSAYDQLKKKYNEENIVVLGYSIGTGPASKLASTNHPKMLILQAPYYNMTDLMRKTYPIIPTFLLKYRFKTNEYLRTCHMPVVIFHGDQDEVIYYNSSLKLKKEFKAADTLITLNGQTHNGMTDNLQYAKAIQAILSD